MMLFSTQRLGYIDRQDILDWFSTCAEALERSRKEVSDSIAATGAVPGGMKLDRLRFLTISEIDAYFRDALRELELSAVLWMITHYEGKLRIDVQQRRGDADFLAHRLSILLQSHAQEFRISLIDDDGILGSGKEFVKHAIPPTDPQRELCLNAIGSLSH